MKKPFTTAVLLCAGSGSRIGGNVPKQYLLLDGKPVCMHTASRFQECDAIDAIVLVCPKGDVKRMEEYAQKYAIEKVVSICEGGKTRQQSVGCAILHLPQQTEFIAIHDGARCLIESCAIEQVVKEAYDSNAAIAAGVCVDTLKQTDATKCIQSTPDRNCFAIAQTPQVFELNLYRAAYEKAISECVEYTDDSALVEAISVSVKCVFLNSENRKITLPSDIGFAEFVLKNRTKAKAEVMKIGHGYDVHRLKDGRDLIIGGVKIPYEKGLDGHSDADVLVHAIMDALLGAAGLPDIGALFPDSDMHYHNADSLKLLSKVAEMLSECGYLIENIDSTIIAQAPKMAPHISQMKQKIAAALHCSENKINVKATTEEHLGFTGSGEGISAHAVCLLKGTA